MLRIRLPAIRSRAKAETRPAEKAGTPRRRSVSLRHLALFCRQLGTMYSAGIPIIQALRTVATQVPNPYFGVVLRIVAQDVGKGSTLAWALERHPRVFPPILTRVVAAGEASGNLDNALDRSAAHFEREHEVRAKVRGALMYPVIILVLAICVSIFLIVVVIPNFASIFESLGAEGKLPIPTRIMIAVGEFAQAYFLWMMVAFIVLAYGVFKYIQTPEGRYRLDVLMLRLPIISQITMLDGVSRFCRTLAALTNTGIALPTGLGLVEQAIGNKVLGQAVAQTRDAVRRGERISDPLQRTKVFPQMVPQMIAVGEETGQVGTMLDKLADYYERDLTILTDGFSKLIEPVMIIFLAVVVGFIVISVALPMFEMWTVIG